MRKVCTRILSIVGNVLTVRAEGVKYEELAEVKTAMGRSLAQVIRLDKDMVYKIVKKVFHTECQLKECMIKAFLEESGLRPSEIELCAQSDTKGFKWWVQIRDQNG